MIFLLNFLNVPILIFGYLLYWKFLIVKKKIFRLLIFLFFYKLFCFVLKDLRFIFEYFFGIEKKFYAIIYF